MSSRTTTDHADIQRWTEERGGKPACVIGTGGKRHDPGVLRLAFPERAQSDDAGLKEISWDEWFEAFDANDLALVVQDETADDKLSRFNKLVSRETAGRAGGEHGASRHR